MLIFKIFSMLTQGKIFTLAELRSTFNNFIFWLKYERNILKIFFLKEKDFNIFWLFLQLTVISRNDDEMLWIPFFVCNSTDFRPHCIFLFYTQTEIQNFKNNIQIFLHSITRHFVSVSFTIFKARDFYKFPENWS